MNDHLELFLKNYKPKDLKSVLNKYINMDELKDYSLLKNKNIDNLKFGKTLIKYIKIDDLSNNKIKNAGVLIGGGKSIKGKITENNNWTHIMTKIKTRDDKDKILTISLKNNYIFYKKDVSFDEIILKTNKYFEKINV